LWFERLELRVLLAADLGDAPSPLPAASHEAIGPRLGALRDAATYATTPGANADGADDDGVFFGTLRIGQTGAVITVNVQNAPAGARLDAWWDFNRNNAWAADEQIADNLAVVNGDNSVTFNIPATAADGLAYARFRLSTAGDLAVGGAALGGEVEDYFIPIARSEDATFGGQNLVNFTNAVAVTAADIDGDGDEDVVTGGNSRLDLHENFNGVFAAPRPIDGTVNVAFVKVADIDHDGLLDVLSLAVNTGLRWYENDGDGTFTTRTISISGVTRVDLGDADGDGDLDLLVGRGPSLPVAWVYFDGGSFGVTQTVASDLTNATAVTAVDFDGDGDVDALAADASDDVIAWFAADEGGLGFTRHTITTSADNVRTATPADVDGDGDLDVLASVTSARDLVWYENDGDGEFEFHLIAAAGALGPPLLQAGDLDGDGDADLLASTSTQLKWYENDGLETFTPHTLLTGATSVQGIATDIDGDGRLDIVSVRGTVTPQITWQRQLAAMDFGDAPMHYRTALQNNGARHIAVGPTLGALRDAELDSLPNDAAAGEAEDDGVTFGVIRAGGYGATVTVNVQNAPDGARLDAWIDFDGDGAWGGANEQIAASRKVVEGDNVLTFDVAPGTSSGVTFARFRLSTAGGAGVDALALDGEVEDYAVTVLAPAATTGHFGSEHLLTPAYARPANAVAADLDGDGDGDLIVASESGGSKFYENRGAEGFVLNGGTTGDVSLVAEDYDGDGDLDVLGAGQARVTWYENVGPWSFSARNLLVPVPSGLELIQSIFAADIDGDGDADVLATDFYGEAWLFENLGQGQVSSRVFHVQPSAPEAIIVVDVDSDGDLDAVVAGGAIGGQIPPVAWYENRGQLNLVFAGNVGSPPSPGVNISITDIAAADLDGDGDMDVVSTDNSATGRVTWYENDGDQVFLVHQLFGAAGGQSIDLADVDGDGDVDILAAGFGTSVILENYGNAQFARRTLASFTPTPTPSEMYSRIVASDLDGDHDIDAFFATAGRYAWYANLPLDQPDYGDAPNTYGTLREDNGAEHNAVGPRLGALRDSEADGVPTAGADAADDDDGVTFGLLQPGDASATVTINVQNAPAGARIDAWIDFNGDGSWQIAEEQVVVNAAAVEGDNVLRFTVPGTATAGPTFARVRVSTAGGHGPRGFAADGEVEDYAVVIERPGETTGDYARFRSAFGNVFAVVRMADVDGDGDVDAVADSSMAPYNLNWLENLGDGAFLTHPIDASPASDLQVVDLDRDGDADFVVRSGWYENNGEQSFRRHEFSPFGGGIAISVDVADADQDGDWDVLVGGTSFGVYWLINNGQQTFTTQAIYPVILAQKARAVDVDGDGDLDVVAGAPSFTWHENRGGHYLSHAQESLGIPQDLVPADLDRDGDVDVVVRRDSLVTWYENVGVPTFVPHTLLSSFLSSGNAQGRLAVADLEGDGDMDVLLASSNQPRWLRNDGAQNFSLQLVGPMIGPPDVPVVSVASLTVADINGDGRLEVFVGGSSGGSGWYEAVPRGDYDRNGSVDGTDLLEWQRTLGGVVAPAGAGADGDRSGVVDGGDLEVWEQHVGGQLIPRVRAANSNPSTSEHIDGFDFLSWQRSLGTPFNDWDFSGKADAGDLAVWQRQFGGGLIPDYSWINSSPSVPAVEPATQPALAADVILSAPATVSSRTAHAPARRAERFASVTTMRDAALQTLSSPAAPHAGPADRETEQAASKDPSTPLELVDAAFDELL
jgi:hypothetical protein